MIDSLFGVEFTITANYFGEDGNNIVVILCGVENDSQSQDIENAKAYWQEYQNAKTQNAE